VLCHNCVSGEQLVLTFRTKHPGLTQDMVRAAKVRFIAHCLPHVRGSSVRQYTDFVRAYRDFAPNLEAEAIISMLMQSMSYKVVVCTVWKESEPLTPHVCRVSVFFCAPVCALLVCTTCQSKQ